MAEYKGIKGYKVQSLASDPSGPDGQVWYNNAGYALKYQSNVGAWASGGNLNTTRGQVGGIGISAPTSLAFGGQANATTIISDTEEYNGTAWTEVNNIPTSVNRGGSGGVLTAGWAAGGTSIWNGSVTPSTMFLYDGTSWSTGGALQTARNSCRGAGTQTTAILAGGQNTPGGSTTTETYNGSSWASVNGLTTRRYGQAQFGTSAAGLVAGGHTAGSLTANTEEWDGNSWTETNNLNQARQMPGAGGGTATSTSALVIGGYQEDSFPPYETANVESWNGTSWTEIGNLATNRSGAGASTTGNTSALAFGGLSGPPSYAYVNATEEFSYANVVKTVTVS